MEDETVIDNSYWIDTKKNALAVRSLFQHIFTYSNLNDNDLTSVLADRASTHSNK